MADNQINKAELARRLGVRPQSVDYRLTRKSIDTDTDVYKRQVGLSACGMPDGRNRVCYSDRGWICR